MSAPPEGPKASRGRRALVLGGIGLAAVGLVNAGPLARALWPRPLDFEPLETPAGFRRLADGAGSASAPGGAALIGLTAPGPRPAATPEDVLTADLCGALFGTAAPGPGVRVAKFSDYYCPYCRILARRLAALEEEGLIRVAWHEWPLFGETSEAAARAALAARRQGAYLAFHDAMMGGRFVPTEGFLADLAGRLGLDPARLRADMQGPEVAREIADARGLAGLFGFWGTPALVVGRTALTGAVDEGTLRALIAAEAASGPPPGCAA